MMMIRIALIIDMITFCNNYIYTYMIVNNNNNNNNNSNISNISNREL